MPEDSEQISSALDVQVGRTWTEEQWRGLLEKLVEDGLAKWSEIAAITLGELNPPQVGTSPASNKNIQARYDSKKAWQAVKAWLYTQPLGCRECGTLLELEAEHIVPKEELGVEADRLTNMQLLRQMGNPKALQIHLGHASPFMTMRYLGTLTAEDAIRIRQQVEFGQ